MTDLKLEVGEGILLQTNDAGLYDGNNETDIDELYLTNKSIIYVHEKSTGMFKSETVVDRIPLSSIAVINGVVQVEQVDDDDYGKSLQIIYTNGKRELLELNVAPKKQYPAWKTAIADAVIRLNTGAPMVQETPQPVATTIANGQKSEFVAGATSIFAELKSVANSVKQTFTEAAETIQGKNSSNEPISETPPAESPAEKKYIYCSNCGERLTIGSKFCNSCGTPVGTIPTEPKKEEPIVVVSPPPVKEDVTPPPITENKSQEKIKTETPGEPSTERKTVYDGAIHKCPNCGEVVNSFVSICPACGFELGGKQVSSTLQKFIDKVNECDRLIANSPAAKTGWGSWSKSKRFWWVILNLFFVCIPLVIYLVLPLIMIKSTPKLTSEEKQMASLIENFPFPNDRESILAALIYAKEKIDFISKEKIDRKSAYWMRLWCAKAEQLKQKADMLFPNDSIVKQSYAEIIADDERVKKTIKIKAIVGLVILVVAIAFLLIRNGTFDDIKVANTLVDIPETELSVLMPQIEGGKGEIVTNNSEYFSVTYYGISSADFETYKKDCKTQGFTIDCENTGSLFDAYNEDGYNIRITYYSSEMHITVSDNLEMRTIVWPSSEVADLLPKPKSDYGNISSSSDTCLIIYIGNMSMDDYAEYVNECIKKGFTKDMSQTDDHYHADNADGYHVMVEYRGFNTVFIRVDD